MKKFFCGISINGIFYNILHFCRINYHSVFVSFHNLIFIFQNFIFFFLKMEKLFLCIQLHHMIKKNGNNEVFKNFYSLLLNNLQSYLILDVEFKIWLIQHYISFYIHYDRVQYNTRPFLRTYEYNVYKFYYFLCNFPLRIIWDPHFWIFRNSIL